MLNKFKVLDESGDRKYFTIIPNYIVNHSTPYEQAIYLFMKRVAGENGTCWTSAQEIARKLGCSRNTITKYRNKLVKRGWIQKVGHKKVGATSQTVLEFKIVDLWELNNEFYAKKGKVSNNDSLEKVSPSDESRHVATAKVSTGDGKVSLRVHKEEPMKKNPEEDNTKDETSSSEIPLLIKEFETLNPASKRFYGNTTQRSACEFLIKTYGFDRIIKVVQSTLPKTNGLQFFPTITTPLQLQDKWIALESAIRKYQSEKLSTKEKYKVI